MSQREKVGRVRLKAGVGEGWQCHKIYSCLHLLAWPRPWTEDLPSLTHAEASPVPNTHLDRRPRQGSFFHWNVVIVSFLFLGSL